MYPLPRWLVLFLAEILADFQIKEEFISYTYSKFYNKISETSLSQWIPNKLDLHRDLICSSGLRGAIEEIELADGNVIDWQWIRHHFEFE